MPPKSRERLCRAGAVASVLLSITALGIHVIEVEVDPPAGTSDTDTSNNRLAGTRVFVEAAR